MLRNISLSLAEIMASEIPKLSPSDLRIISHSSTDFLDAEIQKSFPSAMRIFETPCFADLVEEWLCSNDRTFAIISGFPVPPAHMLVTTNSIVEMCFGASNEEQVAKEIGWSEVPGTAIKPGKAIARVRDRSMKPKIKDNLWNLFRERPEESCEGRIVLVQFNSIGTPKNGGPFTVKKYHSAKTVSEDAWQHDRIELLPINPDYDLISIAPHEGPEMVVVAEWMASID